VQEKRVKICIHKFLQLVVLTSTVMTTYIKLYFILFYIYNICKNDVTFSFIHSCLSTRRKNGLLQPVTNKSHCSKTTCSGQVIQDTVQKQLIFIKKMSRSEQVNLNESSEKTNFYYWILMTSQRFSDGSKPSNLMTPFWCGWWLQQASF